MTDPLALGTTPLPACPGRTWFDTLVEGWHDQAMMRRHMEGLHALDMERAQQRPVYALTVASATGPMRFVADPDARTVTFTVPKGTPPMVLGEPTEVIPLEPGLPEPVYPAPWLPEVPVEDRPTAELEAVPTLGLREMFGYTP